MVGSYFVIILYYCNQVIIFCLQFILSPISYILKPYFCDFGLPLTISLMKPKFVLWGVLLNHLGNHLCYGHYNSNSQEDLVVKGATKQVLFGAGLNAVLSYFLSLQPTNDTLVMCSQLEMNQR